MDLLLPINDMSPGNPGKTRVTALGDGPEGRDLDAWHQHLGQGLGLVGPARMDSSVVTPTPSGDDSQMWLTHP